MADLFSWFQSYLNLSKITAVTVPGMVVAFALILVLGPIPCRDNKDCPFCSATLKPVANDASAKTAGSGGSSGEAKYIEGTKEQLSDKDLQSKLGAIYTLPKSCDSLPGHLLDGSIQGEPIAHLLDPKLDESIDLSKLKPALKDCGKWLTDTSSDIGKKVKQAATADKKKYEDAATAIGTFQSRVAGLQKIAGGAAANITWVQVSQDSFKDENLTQGVDVLLKNAGITQIDMDCNTVPRFFAANSLSALGPNPTDDDVSKANAAAAKKALRLVQLNVVVGVLNSCNNKLQKINADLTVASSSLDKLITQENTNLTSLSSNLITVQQSGESLVAEGIRRSVAQSRDKLDDLQRQQATLKAAATALGVVQSRVSGMITPSNAPAVTAPPPGNTAIDVFQTIEQNLLKFLLFSLILGQILDPIQRGAMSFIGPRRNLFSSLNQVYGQDGDGEFRYGERRLMPWVTEPGYVVPVDAASAPELRPNDAGRKFGESRPSELSDRNIYDKNYAVGAGFITAKEASSIDDEYYAQSQITSGLILPFLILSICIAIRIICCSAAAAANGTYQGNTGLAFSAITFGIVLGLALMLFVLLMTSGSYWNAVTSGIRYFWLAALELFPVPWKRRDREYVSNGGTITPFRFWTFILVGLVFVAGWIFSAWFLIEQMSNSTSAYLDYSSLLLIMLPALLMGPLWVAGLDRLHKYYSELEARIAGNILRLNSNTEKKMADLINDPLAARKLRDSLETSLANREKIVNFLASIDSDKDKK